MKPSIRSIALLFACLVSVTLSAAMWPTPALAQPCKLFGTCGSPLSEAFSPGNIQKELGSCFSGGCDPARIIQNFDGSSEAWGELSRELYVAAAETMAVRHQGSQR